MWCTTLWAVNHNSISCRTHIALFTHDDLFNFSTIYCNNLRWFFLCAGKSARQAVDWNPLVYWQPPLRQIDVFFCGEQNLPSQKNAVNPLNTSSSHGHDLCLQAAVQVENYKQKIHQPCTVRYSVSFFTYICIDRMLSVFQNGLQYRITRRKSCTLPMGCCTTAPNYSF